MMMMIVRGAPPRIYQTPFGNNVRSMIAHVTIYTYIVRRLEDSTYIPSHHPRLYVQQTV